MMELKKVSAGYEGKSVVCNVDLIFERGKITVLVGPNGCGKSTLLKSMVGIVPLTEGDILIQGDSIRKMQPKQLAKAVAYLAQNKKAPDISVMKMVLHGRFAHLGPHNYSIHRK